MADFFDEEAEMSADGSHSDDEMSDEVETAEDRAMIDDEHQGDDDSDVDNAVQADAAMAVGEAERDMQEAREIQARMEAQHGKDEVVMSTDDEEEEEDDAMPAASGRQLTLSQMVSKKRKRSTQKSIESGDSSDDSSDEEENTRVGCRPRVAVEEESVAPAPVPVEAGDDDGDGGGEETRPRTIPRIPPFKYSGVYANKSVHIFSPNSDLAENAPQQPTSTDDDDGDESNTPVRILSFKLPFDEDKSIFENKNRHNFMLFQAVYYVMCAAGHLCSKGAHLSTYLYVLKENSTTTENMMERVNRINFNKGKGHYLMEIHIEDDDALFQLTKFLEDGEKMFQKSWKYGGTTPSFDLKEKAVKVEKNPETNEAVGHLYTSTTDLASGLVELAKEMGTILRNNPPVWARQAKVPDILKVANYQVGKWMMRVWRGFLLGFLMHVADQMDFCLQVQDTEPPELQSIEKNPNFWSMFSRESVFNALYSGNHQMQARMAQALENGQPFMDGYKACECIFSHLF